MDAPEPIDEFVEAHIRQLSDAELVILASSDPPTIRPWDPKDEDVCRFLEVLLALEWPQNVAVARQELARRRQLV